jgi:TRAP-type transport system small permease protein
LVLMLYCIGLVFKGSYDQTVVNWDSTSAVMEVSMGYFYASGMVFAVLGGLVLLSDLWRLVTGQIRDDQLVLMQESEEAPHGESKTAN